MLDKSIENVNYPPFVTIVRGTSLFVWGIFPKKDSVEIIVDVQV